MGRPLLVRAIRPTLAAALGADPRPIFARGTLSFPLEPQIAASVREPPRIFAMRAVLMRQPAVGSELTAPARAE